MLFLTNNQNLGSTARILQAWLSLIRQTGTEPRIVVRETGDLATWLCGSEYRTCIDPMPLIDKCRPWHGLWHAWRVARFAKGCEVIHCNEHDVYPFLIGLRRFLCLPAVCHVRYRIGREWAEWAFRGKRCPDALLWTSQQQKDDSAAAVEGIVPEDRQHVVRLGFDLDTYGTLAADREATRRQWGIQPGEIVVGTASPLRPRKRVHEFIELIVALAKRHPNVVGLVAGGDIAGDESYREQIEQQIASVGLGRRLRWLGFLEPVEPFYHACDVQVSTSEYETFGNSVCEAMACARPVAAYRGGSVAEVVGDSGLIVETGDLPGLTAAVDRLVVNADLRQRLGQAARQRVAQHFNPRMSFEQLQIIYRQVLGGRPAKADALSE